MTRQMSFKMHQKEVEPRYRTQIDAAESTEDVRTILDFLRRALGDQVELQPGDVTFDPYKDPGYTVSQRIRDNENFRQAEGGSDLAQIMRLLSGRAQNRYKYLSSRHPDKTEVKIFQVPGPRSH